MKQTGKDAEEKALILKMKNLLLRGARMLDETCPRCNTPLFYIKETGLKYCPKCNVYLATPEELEKVKIDKKRLKIFDFDEYWEMQKEKTIEKIPREKTRKEPQVENHEQIGKEAIPSTKLSDALDELIIAIIEKLIILIDKNYENMKIENLIEILRELIQLKKSL